MNVDLIALDLDDTLLRDDLQISPANRRALALAEERGIRIVLASGRNIHSMRHYASLLGLDAEGDYLICSNGGEILESWSGKVIHQSLLSSELCREIARAIDERGLPWQIYDEGKIHLSRPNPWAKRDSEMTGQPTVEVLDEEAYFARGQVKFVVPAEAKRISRLLDELRPLFAGKAEVMTSKPYYLEVLPLGTDKGTALRRLTSMLGIDIARTMAVGDAMNDLGMVKAAGWGCAPSNASAEVKAAARLVSEFSNEEDAVADLIQRVALS